MSVKHKAHRQSLLLWVGKREEDAFCCCNLKFKKIYILLASGCSDAWREDLHISVGHCQETCSDIHWFTYFSRYQWELENHNN
jgi:hypothetical protein